MRGLRFVAVLAAVTCVLAAAHVAAAASPLGVGVVEDSPIWSDPFAQMDLVRLAGFDTVRMTVQWTAGQTQVDPGARGRIARAVAAARARGVRVVLAIYNADWHSTPADDAGRSQFVAFLSSVVRSIPLASDYIVGNEPNYGYYWRPQFDSAGGDAAAPAYEQLLAASYDAVKAIRPDATVYAGALDPHGNDNPNGRESHSPTTFIRDLGAAYRASGRTAPLMDVFDEHVYSDSNALPPAMAHPSSTTVTEGDYAKLVSLLGAAFDGTAQKGSTLPILFGEYGADTTIPAAKAGAYHGTEPVTTVDEATQAAYYTQALKVAMCQPNVIALMLFHVEDESDLDGWQSGLFYADGTPKSSLAPVSQAIAGARAGTLTSCPDQTAPAVTLAAPATDGTVTVGATDDVGVGGVSLTVNGAPAGQHFVAPYVFDWTPPAPGVYDLVAKAYDAAGNVGSAELVVSAVPAARSDASGAAAAWEFGTPPANDAIAAAQRLAGRAGSVSGSSEFATRGPGESKPSVWFAWRAPATGTLRLAVGGGAKAALYGGQLDTLARVRSVVRGVTYRIAVLGRTPSFTLAWQLAPVRAPRR